MSKVYKITITCETPEAEELAENFISEEFRAIEEAAGNIEGLSVELSEPRMITVANLRLEISSKMSALDQDAFLANLKENLEKVK